MTSQGGERNPERGAEKGRRLQQLGKALWLALWFGPSRDPILLCVDETCRWHGRDHYEATDCGPGMST